MAALLDQRALTAAELAGVLVDLGQTRQAAITTRAEVWRQTAHLGVTERREECRAHVDDLEGEVAALEQEAEALRVKLAQIDAELAWSDRGA